MISVIGLTHILNESGSMAIDPIVIIDDNEVLNAIEEYNKGRKLKKEGENLIDHARSVLDRKLYENGVMRSESNQTIVEISEYDVSIFDKKKFKEDNPDVYDRYNTNKVQHKYVFTSKS